MTILKPMLAVDAGDVSKLKYPVLASPKLDGIRCVRQDGEALSRKFKPIPNNFIREWLERWLPDLSDRHLPVAFDGELMVGKNFQETSSGVMSIGGEPDFTYMLFDYCDDQAEPFFKRYERLCAWYEGIKNYHPDIMKRVKVVPHVICNNSEELQKFEEWCVENGYEGAMTRSMQGPYKNGRATLREQYLLKLKRWKDDEGVIFGFEEQMQNTNEAQEDAFGRTKRSTHKEGMVPKNTLGSFNLHWKDEAGVTHQVDCGSGLNDTLRREIWFNKEKYLGKIVTFKWQPHGSKDVPRFPIFKGFRHPDDTGEPDARADK